MKRMFKESNLVCTFLSILLITSLISSAARSDAFSGQFSAQLEHANNVKTTSTNDSNQTAESSDLQNQDLNSTNQDYSAAGSNSSETISQSNDDSTSDLSNTNTTSTNDNSTYTPATKANTTETEGNSNDTSMNDNSTSHDQQNSTDVSSLNSTITDESQASIRSVDFYITPEFNSTNIKVGEVELYMISINSINHFNSSVILSIPETIPGVVTAFTSNPLTVPDNGTATSTLVVVTTPYSATGRWDLTINGTATLGNTTVYRSSVMTVETWKQDLPPDPEPSQSSQPQTVASQVEKTGIEAMNLTQTVEKDLNGQIINDVKNKQLVILSTTVSNNNNSTQAFVLIIEILDDNNVVDSIQMQKGMLPPLGQVEAGMSWNPQRAGMYELRSFVVNVIGEGSEPLSTSTEKSILVA